MSGKILRSTGALIGKANGRNYKLLRTLAIGDGHVEFEPFFGLVKEKNYSGDFTLEATAFDATGAVNVEKLNRCVAYVRTKMQEKQ